MPVFSFVVARFVPDMVKNEPVNVGVMVRDSKTGHVGSRFTDNFQALARRYPEAHVWALKSVLESFRNADGRKPEGYLEKIRRNHVYQLRFTDMRAVESDRVEDAVETLYARYIGEAKIRQRREPAKAVLVSTIRKEIDLAGFPNDCVKTSPKIKGKIGHFVFDYGFQNGRLGGLVHSISFARRADVAYRDAKELAVSVEDAVAVHDGLDCVAIIRPPSDKKAHSEFYVPAKGHLEDKNCSVVDESGIRGSLIRIRKKIGA